jgi:hypothetical protein
VPGLTGPVVRAKLTKAGRKDPSTLSRGCEEGIEAPLDGVAESQNLPNEESLAYLEKCFRRVIRTSALSPICGQPRTTETAILGEKMVIRQLAVPIARIFLLQAIEKEHFVRAFVLGFDRTARLEFE